MPSETPVVEVRDLAKTYRLGMLMKRRVQALSGIGFRIERGQVFGLVGPNGAGKSTTIKILMNLVQATSGEARLFGMKPDKPQARRRVGFLPENPAPYEYLTGREFLTLAAQLSGVPSREIPGRVDEVLGLLDMQRAAGLQIRRYSKGMVQRISLGHAVVSRPELLILDEPTSGLDPVGRRQIRDLILAEKERGTTVLFCTHIIPDVEALCDRVAVLVGGKLVRDGTVAELLSAQSDHVEVIAEGVTRAAVEGLGLAVHGIRELNGRVLVRASEADVSALLQRLLSGGARIRQVQNVRFSLEDLFMDAVQKVQGGVGGQIQ